MCKCEQLVINSDCCIEISHFWGPEGSTNNFICGRFNIQRDDLCTKQTETKLQMEHLLRHTQRAVQGCSSTEHDGLGCGRFAVSRITLRLCGPTSGPIGREQMKVSATRGLPAAREARAEQNQGFKEPGTSRWLCTKPGLRCAPRAERCLRGRAGAGSLPAARWVLGARCTWPCQQHPAGGLMPCQPRTPTAVAQQSVPQRWSSCPGESTSGWFPRALPRWVLPPPEQRGWSLGGPTRASPGPRCRGVCCPCLQLPPFGGHPSPQEQAPAALKHRPGLAEPEQPCDPSGTNSGTACLSHARKQA